MRIALSTLILVLMGMPATPEPSPELLGIAHVAFRVSDVSRAREFYRKLGFEQAFEFADPGKPPVSYMKINDRQFIELYGRADDSQPLGLMHVCYEVADIRVAREKLKAQGARVLGDGEPKVGAHGKPVLFLHPKDFCGTLVELEQA